MDPLKQQEIKALDKTDNGVDVDQSCDATEMNDPRLTEPIGDDFGVSDNVNEHEMISKVIRFTG